MIIIVIVIIIIINQDLKNLPRRSSNQKPLKTLYNDGKKKEKKSETNINVNMI